MKNQFYAHVNLFVGKYKVPTNGHIRLDKARVRLLCGREESGGFHQRQADETDEQWLIVEESGFWPVMVRLNEDDLAELGLARV